MIVVVGSALACGPKSEEGPSNDLRAEVRALETILADDLVLLAVRDADDAVAEDLPVRAAGLLRDGAIPAARRQAEQVRAADVTTPEGLALRDEAARALDARTAALEQYADVLARGLLEDLELAMALRAQREAEGTIDTLLARLEALRSPSEDSRR